jgi:hypothetical protein
VEVDAPTLRGAAARTCDGLMSALPDTVAGLPRQQVEPAGGHAAAWGEEAPIVLRCGVPRPAGFDRFATCQETNGVGWFIPEEQITGEPVDVTMTTIGRVHYVEVVVPADHWPPAETMVDLAGPIKRSVREVDPCV